MNKTDFKKMYRNYRESISRFNAKLEYGNFPCGYDDYLCEQFENSRIKFLKDKPILKKLLNNMDSFDGKYNYNWLTERY